MMSTVHRLTHLDCPYGVALADQARQLAVNADLSRFLARQAQAEGHKEDIAEINSVGRTAAGQASEALGKLAACNYCTLGVVRPDMTEQAAHKCPNKDVPPTQVNSTN